MPGKHSTLAALAFAHHLNGSLDEAIGLYHGALSLDPDDVCSARMLSAALGGVLAGPQRELLRFASEDAEALRVVEALAAAPQAKHAPARTPAVGLVAGAGESRRGEEGAHEEIRMDDDEDEEGDG